MLDKLKKKLRDFLQVPSKYDIKELRSDIIYDKTCQSGLNKIMENNADRLENKIVSIDRTIENHIPDIRKKVEEPAKDINVPSKEDTEVAIKKIKRPDIPSTGVIVKDGI